MRSRVDLQEAWYVSVSAKDARMAAGAVRWQAADLELADDSENHPQKIALPGGWRLRAENLPASPELFEQARSNSDLYQAWLDQEKLALPLSVRARQPGERFYPLGMWGRSMKLADFMINTDLPRRSRNGWPLVISGEQVAWVPGYRMGENFAVNENTCQIVHLSLHRIDSPKG